jgi:folate-binding Fe-S cluster repair protein YgfZ
MDNPTLFATLIGLLTGVSSSFVTHFLQIRLEKQKKQLETEINRKNEFKKEIANTVQVIMSMVQEIAWVLWEVSKGKAEKSKDYLNNYNLTAKNNLSKTSAQLALLAATDLSIYNTLREIAQDVYNLDLDLANNLVDFVDGKTSIENFSELKEKVSIVETELPKKFAEILIAVDKS